MLASLKVILAPHLAHLATPGKRLSWINSALAAITVLTTLLTGCGGSGGGANSSSTSTPVGVLMTPNATIQASALHSPRFAVAMDDMEVIGPFPSWANAKRDYGAVGDGVADDAPALQRALNELGLPGKASVLYLPPGNYKIGTTLRLNWNAQIGGYGWGGVGIVGESPSTTKISWAGPAGGAMLIQDGGYNTRYARITWDGKGTAGYGIAHWWNSKAGTLYDGSSEDVDEVFQDMGIGIMAGRQGASYSQMNSEGQIRRVTFLRNTYAGLDTGSFNALDWWVFDSHFVDCARGVTNTFGIDDAGTTLGAGGFYVYRSVFERSTVADVHIKHTGWFSMHQNVSVGSRRFFQGESMGSNAAPIIIKGNRIIDTTASAAILNGNLGPLLLIDNQIRSAPNVTAPAVMVNDYISGRDVVSIGNSYTVANPVLTVDSTDRYVSVNDTIVGRAAISSAVPTPPPTPQRLSRQIFEVPSGANAAQIQAAINAAVASGTTNPIVHLPPGIYNLTQTLVVPAKARIQLAGDALTTTLQWAGNPGGTLISLNGPSYTTVRDMQLLGSTATAIAINSADQAGGRIFIEGSSSGPLIASNLQLTQLSLQATTGLDALSLSNVQSFVAIGNGVIGPISSTNNSNALIADTWYEGPESHLVRITSGTFTLLGGLLAPASHSGATQPDDPAIQLEAGFAGRATFVGTLFDLSHVPSGIGIDIGSETSDTNALFLGMSLVSSTPQTYFNRASSAGNVGLLISKTRDAQGVTISSPEKGINSSAFLLSMLTQARSLTWDTAPYAAPTMSTDVRIYRIKASATKGISISGS